MLVKKDLKGIVSVMGWNEDVVPRLVRAVTMLTPDREGLYTLSEFGCHDDHWSSSRV
jgi:hypothetical protein